MASSSSMGALSLLSTTYVADLPTGDSSDFGAGRLPESSILVYIRAIVAGTADLLPEAAEDVRHRLGGPAVHRPGRHVSRVGVEHAGAQGPAFAVGHQDPPAIVLRDVAGAGQVVPPGPPDPPCALTRDAAPGLDLVVASAQREG